MFKMIEIILLACPLFLWSPPPFFSGGVGGLFNPFLNIKFSAPCFFLFSLFGKLWEKDWSCDHCWPHLQGLEQNGFANFCGSPLSAGSALRFSSWLGLPGESLSPTEHAIRLEDVCWYLIVTSCRIPPWLSGPCTPRCFNLFMERWVRSPVS